MDGVDTLTEFRALCPNASLKSEGGVRLIDLPDLPIPTNGTVARRHALLAIDPHNGYPTRLYLSERIDGKGQNWNVFSVLGRPWHACSWGDVHATLRPIEILAEHLRAFR